MNKKTFKYFSKNFYNTNITKISEISKFISTFLKYFYMLFKNFDITNITKNFEISKVFELFF